jgi:hypothetical protein
MPTFKSYLKPENSIIAGLAVMGLVYADYQLNCGTSAQVQMTDANHPAIESSRKKAGYTAVVLVAGIGLIAKDANIIILGAASIIALELTYRHAIMAEPQTGVMQPPTQDTYMPMGVTSDNYDQENYVVTPLWQ